MTSTFTIYCSGDTEAARHERVDIGTLADVFGELMPGSEQTLVGDRPVRISGSAVQDAVSGPMVVRSRTRYECPACGLTVTVTTETWDRKVRDRIDALMDHGVTELPLVALGRTVSAS